MELYLRQIGPITERELSRRWAWSRSKVRRFLKLLESRGIAKKDQKKDQEKDHPGSTFWTLNFQELQQVATKPDENEGQKKTRKKTTKKTTSKTAKIEVLPDFPASLASEACKQAFLDWISYRRKIGKSYKDPNSYKKIVEQFAPLGEARFLAAIQHSIAMGYQGLYEPKTTKSAKPTTEQKLQELFNWANEE